MNSIFGIKTILLGGMRRVVKNAQGKNNQYVQHIEHGKWIELCAICVFFCICHRHPQPCQPKRCSMKPKHALWWSLFHKHSPPKVFTCPQGPALEHITNLNSMHWHRHSKCFIVEAAQIRQRCMCMRLVLRECEHSTVIVYAKHVAMRGVRWVAQVFARGVQWEYSSKLCISGAAESRGAIHVHFACPRGEDHLIIRSKRRPGTMKKDVRPNFFVGSA